MINLLNIRPEHVLQHLITRRARTIYVIRFSIPCFLDYFTYMHFKLFKPNFNFEFIFLIVLKPKYYFVMCSQGGLTAVTVLIVLVNQCDCIWSAT